MEKPYEQRVREVIDEELSRAGITRMGLDRLMRQALGNVTTRLATDLENLHEQTGCRCGDVHNLGTS